MLKYELNIILKLLFNNFIFFRPDAIRFRFVSLMTLFLFYSFKKQIEIFLYFLHFNTLLNILVQPDLLQMIFSKLKIYPLYFINAEKFLQDFT